MGGVRECQTGGVLRGWRERMRARAESGYHLSVGLWTCDGWKPWYVMDPLPALPLDALPRLRLTNERLTHAPAPAWALTDCSGSSDLDALFGLVGGPAAQRLPLPALADVRTVTWPVGW